MLDKAFQPVNTIVCETCKAQNLGWCLACWECGKSLDKEDGEIDHEVQLQCG